MASESSPLSGLVTKEIGDEITKIRVTSTQAPEPYFVVKHTLPIPGVILIGVPDQPIAFEVTSRGTRGFTTTLSYTGQTAAGQDEGAIAVTTLNSFDPTSIGDTKTLRLDRWSGLNKALALGSQATANWETPSTTSGNRSVLELTVASLLTVHAGGIEWNVAGPRDTSLAEFEVRSKRMALFMPGEVLTHQDDHDLQRLRDILQELADTHSLFDENASSPQIRSLKNSNRTNSQKKDGLSADPASLVYGEELKTAVTPPIELQYAGTGGKSVFHMMLYICPKDRFDDFKNSIPAPAAM